MSSSPDLQREDSREDGRLLVVSNRLPITIKRSQDGRYDFKMSSGGLVSGLSGLSKSTAFRWYGWPGLEVPDNEAGHLRDRLKEDHNAMAVMLNDELADRHYNGFSKVAQDVQDNDLVWIHDYHLMLLPAMLRDEVGTSKKNVKFGFFLHTPFPTSEIYCTLPVSKEILEGVLHCDLIGFHIYDYARHFLSNCSRLLGTATTPSGVIYRDKAVAVGAFPIGIDPEKFAGGLRRDSVQERIRALKQKFDGVKLIVGVDRLDYTKGMLQKLHALEVFLNKHPECVGKVVLIQVAVPSREDVEENQNLCCAIYKQVSRINGRFGTIDTMPVNFMHKSVAFEELVALYAVSDVCLVTSTRDGMNLVAYEYIASQSQTCGALILSNFTGAAQCLDGPIMVNPWHIEEVADAIHGAITMGPEQKKISFQKMYQYVNKHTSAWWGKSFVSELRRISLQAENEAQTRADSSMLKSMDLDARNTADGASLDRELTLETDDIKTPEGVPSIDQVPELVKVVNGKLAAYDLATRERSFERPYAVR